MSFSEKQQALINLLTNNHRNYSNDELDKTIRDLLAYISEDNPSLNFFAVQAYDALQDDESRRIFAYLFLTRFLGVKHGERFFIEMFLVTLKNRLLEKGKDLTHYDNYDLDFFFGKQYFSLPQIISTRSKNEIFIDCGALNGETIKDFVDFTGGSYNKIYSFEPIPSQYKNTLQYLNDANIQRVELIQKGVWSHETVLNFIDAEGGSRIDNNGTIPVQVVPIDGIIPKNEKITFIKMDIEGAEFEALRGAENTIKRCKPILAICVYHKPHDIIEIPTLISSFNPEYKFYIRHHLPFHWETVLYAIPPTTNTSNRSEPIEHGNPSMKHEVTMPKVSVILTSRNHEKFLDEAIQSALSQTYRNFELIIWDDASTDDSWSIIKQYSDNRVHAFRNDVQRYGAYNVNKVIAEIAQGEYIAIHHSDDVWELEKLEKQVAFLDQHPEIGAVFSWVNIIDDDGNIKNDIYLYDVFKQCNKTRHEWLRHFFLSGNALCHPSVLIRKQCYVDCGLYSLALWQLPDFDMWIRLCFRHEIHVLPEHLVKFRWKPDGDNTSAVNQQTLNRSGFEYYMVLNNYCRITSIEEFLKIFPFSEKYCIQPDADLEFALAMTAIETNSSAKYRLFALQLLYKLMTSPERAEKIRNVHHFDYMDFANISKQMQIFATQQSSPAFQTLEPPLKRGIQAFNNEDHETAIECLTTAMTQEPDNPLPYAYLAFICARQGLLEEARDFIAQSIKIAPKRTDLIAALGEVFLKNDKPSEALKYLQEAVHNEPDLFAAYPALAQSLHLTGQSVEAVSLLQSAASLPSNTQAHIRSVLLQILAECGDLSEFTKYSLRFSAGLPDDLLAARCLARFDENGETFLETLSRIQGRLENMIHSSRNNANVIQNEPGLTRIAFMVGDFTSRHQLEQLYALFLHLPTERFFTIFVSCHTRPTRDDSAQMCVMLTDTFLSIHKEDDDSAVEKLCALAPDILVDMEVCAPSERIAVFLSAPVPHKLLWGEAPMPPIAPDVRTLAGACLSVENTLPTVNLPGMGELFNLPELPFTVGAAQKMGEPPVLGCLVPAQGIGRNGWQLFAETLRQHSEATLVINLEELGQAAQTFISGQFSNAGVDCARLVFISVRTAEEFCLAWQSIDLGLLPPTNPGGLALPTCLWMGRPCLIPGSILPWSQRPVALLKALGKEEWMAIGAPHYVELARQLAPPNQRVIPNPALRERMKALGLTDAKGFALGFAEAMTGLSRSSQSAPSGTSDEQ